MPPDWLKQKIELAIAFLHEFDVRNHPLFGGSLPTEVGQYRAALNIFSKRHFSYFYIIWLAGIAGSQKIEVRELLGDVCHLLK